MENYIVIKELPDAYVGTEVIWNEEIKAYCYDKCVQIYPITQNFLSKAQVTQTPEFFGRKKDFPHYYAYKNPVYNRKEILDLIEECFPAKRINNTSISKEIHKFEQKLRELGEINAEHILISKQK